MGADFRKLWAGQTVSLFGSEVTQLALPLVAVLALGAGPAEMGFLRAIQFAPELLALGIGAVVDRTRRRPLLIGADVGRAAVLATVPLAAIVGVLSMAQLYVVAAVLGGLTAVFGIAYVAYLPALVASKALLEGNRRLELSRAAAHATGPALGGSLVQALSAPAALAIDALSFVVSAAFLALIRTREQVQPRLTASVWRDVVDGMLLVLHHPMLRTVTLAAAIWNLCSGGLLDAIYVLYLSRDLGLSPGEIATLFTLYGIGGVLGGLACGRVFSVLGIGPAKIAGGAVAAIGILVVPLVSGSTQQVVAILAVMSLCLGLVGPTFGVASVSIMQAFSPPAMLGRVSAARRWVSVGVVPVGALLGGALGEALGLRAALGVAALGLLLVPITLLLSPLRALRTLPAPQYV